MPATKWDSSLTAAKCELLSYTVSPNDAQNQAIVRGYKGLSYASAASIKAVLDAQTTVTSPSIDGITFSGTWRVDKAQIIRTESGTTAGSHEVRQTMKYGLNLSCMSTVNERLIRSRAYPIEQNENAWMYYELMQNEVSKKWINLSYAAALSEYEYLWRYYDDDDIVYRELNPLLDIRSYFIDVREYMIITILRGEWPSYYGGTTAAVTMTLYYGGNSVITKSFGIEESGQGPAEGYPVDYTIETGKSYIVGVAQDDNDNYYPTLTEITNPLMETWYSEENDGSYTMYRTLKETSNKPYKKVRTLQYAGLARVYGSPSALDAYVYIYGMNDEDVTIYEHTKFRIGGAVYRVTADCEGALYDSEDENSQWVWKPSITPEVTAATEDLVDLGEANETQVYFEAL